VIVGVERAFLVMGRAEEAQAGMRLAGELLDQGLGEARLADARLSRHHAAGNTRRASRSLSFVFSVVIWSTIVSVVVGIVTFCDFKLIGMLSLDGIYHRSAGSSTVIMVDRPLSL
jgi:hypothetical protein